jgi:hypothetical protein
MGIIDGTDPVQLSYSEGYFLHKCDNITVSFDRKIKDLWVHVWLNLMAI